jgi:CRISP-associated protein Cas1
MNKRTLYFGSAAYLKIKNSNLVVEKTSTGTAKSIPIEDIGIIELDNPQITITGYALSFLLQNNTAIVIDD